MGIFAKYKSTYSGHKTTGLQLETCVTLDQLYVPPIICYLMFVSILCAQSTMWLGPNSPRRAMATAGQLIKVTSSRLTPLNTGIFVVATPPSSTFMPYVWMHRSWSPLLPRCQAAPSTARTTLAAQLLRRAREKKSAKSSSSSSSSSSRQPNAGGNDQPKRPSSRPRRARCCYTCGFCFYEIWGVIT